MTHPAHALHHPRRLPRWHRRWVYAIGVVAWASGVAWLIAHYSPRPAGVDPMLPAPSEIIWLRIHGAAVMAFLVAFGTLLPGHVRQGLRQRWNLSSGLAILAICAVLIVTGYGLYYAPSDALRASVSELHWIVGVIAAALLALHAWLGRRIARTDARSQRSLRGIYRRD